MVVLKCLHDLHGGLSAYMCMPVLLHFGSVFKKMLKQRIRWLKSWEIVFGENRKRAGTKAYERYERYRSATNVATAMRLGATFRDLDYDYHHQYLQVKAGLL